MNKFALRSATAAAAITLSFAAPSASAKQTSAPGSSSGSCNTTDVYIGSFAASACRGYFQGNQNSGSAFTDNVKGYLETEFSVTLGTKIIEQIVTGTFADFKMDLGGDVIVGVHWGSNDSAFYLFKGLTLDGVVDPVDFNPSLSGETERGGLSNVALYSSTAAVPEPETYALMLAGLGVVGYMARRRKQQA